MLAPTTGVDASTVLVVPEQVYVYAGAVPPSVQGAEQRSIAICRPWLVFVSSSELVVATVVRVTEDRSSVPELIRSTLRWIVSPAAILVAPTLRR